MIPDRCPTGRVISPETIFARATLVVRARKSPSGDARSVAANVGARAVGRRARVGDDVRRGRRARGTARRGDERHAASNVTPLGASLERSASIDARRGARDARRSRAEVTSAGEVTTTWSVSSARAGDGGAA